MVVIVALLDGPDPDRLGGYMPPRVEHARELAVVPLADGQRLRQAVGHLSESRAAVAAEEAAAVLGLVVQVAGAEAADVAGHRVPIRVPVQKTALRGLVRRAKVEVNSR